MSEALLPPAVLAPLALLLCVAGRRRAAALVLGVFLILGMPALVVWLFGVMAAGAAAAPEVRPGAIVVFASPGDKVAEAAPETLPRLRRGASLARRLGLPVLVAGRADSPVPFEAAEAMAAGLRDDFGVTPRWVVREDGSAADAVGRSASVLRAAGVDAVVLVTSPWERGLASVLLGRAGIRAVPPPGPPVGSERAAAMQFVPLASSLSDSADGLAQAVALLRDRAGDRW